MSERSQLTRPLPLLILWLIFSSYVSDCFSTSQTNNLTLDSVSGRLQSFVSNIGTFNQLFPQEKVYLHFDNTAYFIGETIWFKAYLVTSEKHELNARSKILYVELINQEGLIIDRKRLKIENGQCHGDFQLKEDYYAGYYEIRAYTRAMLNFGRIQQPYEKEIRAFFFNEEYVKSFFLENGSIFSRVLPIYNTPREPGGYHEKVIRIRPKVTGIDPLKKPNKPPIQVTFFPEGGSLTDGLMSRVAFEALTEEGEPIDVQGSVLNENKIFCRFKTLNNGRGEFYVVPNRESPSKVEIQYKGNKYSFPLPDIQANGYVMTVNNVYHGDIQVDIQRSKNQTSEALGLSVVCRGCPVVFHTIQPDSIGSYQIRVQKESLPTGVNQLCLFNSRGEVFAERLVFVNHREYENYGFRITGKKSLYEPYERIALDFYLEKPDEKAYGASSFSLSVCDNETREINTSIQNIRTNLLLSSDVYGFIENPEYYFEKDDKQRHYRLDMLLLVQGWRRYDWQEMSGNKTFEFLHRYEQGNGFELSGQVYPMLGFKQTQEKRLANGMMIEATLLLDSIEYTGNDSIDDQGRFRFQLPAFEGKGELFIKAVESEKTGLWKNEKDESDFFANVLRYESEEGGHWPTVYIPIDENYIPHVRRLSYYETHPKKEIISLIEQKSDLADPLGEAYQIDLEDVSVSKRRIMRTIDYSQPAFRLDPFDELNFQMDHGLFFGPITKSNIGITACVRLGLRGKHIELVNRRAVGGSMTFGGDAIRAEDAMYYLLRHHSDTVNVNNTTSRIPDSIQWRKYSTLENVEQISLYTDKNSRQEYAMKTVLKSYTFDYIINYECFQEKSMTRPVYKGRRIGYQGYSTVSSFYSPNYQKRASMTTPTDYRRTLYWNPDILIDHNGHAHVEFYNNSNTQAIHINAESLSDDGMPIVLSE